jgi:NAD(P)-dependent dehydrogenase (short-subunit alcohol dehydrogenase family)
MATLESKTILIFGGSSGIGYSVAEASLASRAADVIIASSNPSRVSDAVKRLESANAGNGKIRGEVVDVTDSKALKDFMARIGEIDHLVWTSRDKLKLDFPVVDLESMKCEFLYDLYALENISNLTQTGSTFGSERPSSLHNLPRFA